MGLLDPHQEDPVRHNNLKEVVPSIALVGWPRLEDYSLSLCHNISKGIFRQLQIKGKSTDAMEFTQFAKLIPGERTILPVVSTR